LPVFSTASGKAILAFFLEEEAKQIREQNNHQYEPFKVLSLETFFEDICRTLNEVILLMKKNWMKESIL